MAPKLSVAVTLLVAIIFLIDRAHPVDCLISESGPLIPGQGNDEPSRSARRLLHEDLSSSDQGKLVGESRLQLVRRLLTKESDKGPNRPPDTSTPDPKPADETLAPAG